MRIRSISLAFLLVLTALVGTGGADSLVPFKGTWSGRTISATLVEPGVVFVVASGPGHATELGAFTMESPHYSYLADFTVSGQQIFTAANGDTITAEFSGQLLPNADGNLEGTLPATITGGTGRFSGATGSYDFHIIATPFPDGSGFASTATIDGTISSVGSR